jgi:hypothetical protein
MTVTTYPFPPMPTPKPADQPERWSPIIGFPKYEISSAGRVRRWVKPGGTWPRVSVPRILTGFINHSGYRIVAPRDGRGARRHLIVAREVLRAFVGKEPTESHQADHINGNRQDNRAENLVWATPRENRQRQKIHGTYMQGERHPAAKLAESDVAEIRRRRATGEVLTSIAKDFGVSFSTVSLIALNKIWRAA